MIGGTPDRCGHLRHSDWSDKTKVELSRDMGVELARVGRLVMDHLVHQHPGVAPEGQFTGQELEQDDAEGIDVGVGS